ncbi:MAG TPA: nucleotidyltransferase domain-containing protein [Thermodesulfovibrionales bacterium]|nr:nucleotidyltransferase domain-containing protein [Thermodesulfovibrionales bacterium]
MIKKKSKAVSRLGGIAKGRKTGSGDEMEYTKKTVSNKIAEEGIDYSIEKGNPDIERIVAYFKGRDEVTALYLFGSLSKRRENSDSDIDVAVLIDEAKSERLDFDRHKKEYYNASPTFSLRPVDIVILNTAPPFLKHQILKSGKILFDRNRGLRVRFTARAIMEYLDFKPLQDIMLRGVTERFRRVKVGR